MKKAKRNKERYKEVKKALLGNLILGEDEKLMPGADFYIRKWGSPVGAFGTRLFGIAEMVKGYKLVSGNETSAFYQAESAMKQLGRGITFETVNQGCACILKHLFFRPVVLIFEKTEDEKLKLLSYCGRDVLAFSSMKRAMKLFNENKPKGLEPMGQGDTNELSGAKH